MNGDKIYLDSSELELAASSLKSKSTSLSEEYKLNCYSALQQGKSCLEISGLDIDGFFKSLNQIFSNISERCGELSNFLTSTVIANYDQASLNISQYFNSDLSSRISSLLGLGAGIGIGTGAGIIATPSISQTDTSQNPWDGNIGQNPWGGNLVQNPWGEKLSNPTPANPTPVKQNPTPAKQNPTPAKPNSTPGTDVKPLLSKSQFENEVVNVKKGNERTRIGNLSYKDYVIDQTKEGQYAVHGKDGAKIYNNFADAKLAASEKNDTFITDHNGNEIKNVISYGNKERIITNTGYAITTDKKTGQKIETTAKDGTKTTWANGKPISMVTADGKKYCFVAGTKVTTKNGYKNIEDIAIGDEVLSYDLASGKTEYSDVYNTIVHFENLDKLYSISIENDNLNVTESHRFYVINDGKAEWIRAYQLKVGDKLLKSNGELASITAINFKECNENVYNIEVEKNHNYFVGNGYLVHNAK